MNKGITICLLSTIALYQISYPASETETAKPLATAVHDILKQHSQTVDEHGNTALHQAAQDNSDTLISGLIHHEVDLNTQNIDGDTALHIAARLGHTATAKALIDAGAHLTIKNNNGDTALDTAYKATYTPRTDHNGVTNDVQTGTQENQKTYVEIANAQKKLNSRLATAVSDNNIKTATELLNAGANANYNDKHNDYMTLLNIAAKNGDHDMTKLLIAHGADVNDASLHIAAKHGHTDIVTTLHENNADLTEFSGAMAPIHEAALAGNKDMVEHIKRLNPTSSSLETKGFKVTGNNITADEMLKKYHPELFTQPDSSQPTPTINHVAWGQEVPDDDQVKLGWKTPSSSTQQDQTAWFPETDGPLPQALWGQPKNDRGGYDVPEHLRTKIFPPKSN